MNVTEWSPVATRDAGCLLHLPDYHPPPSRPRFVAFAAGTVRVVQEIDIQEIPVQVEEHRGLASWCPQSQRAHHAALPSGIDQGGLVGPRLAIHADCLFKGACHASYLTIGRFV